MLKKLRVKADVVENLLLFHKKSFRSIFSVYYQYHHPLVLFHAHQELSWRTIQQQIAEIKLLQLIKALLFSEKALALCTYLCLAVYLIITKGIACDVSLSIVYKYVCIFARIICGDILCTRVHESKIIYRYSQQAKACTVHHQES